MRKQRSNTLKSFIAGAGGIICLICSLLCENDAVLSKVYLGLSFLMLSVAIGVMISAIKRKSIAVKKGTAFRVIIPAGICMIIFMTVSILQLTGDFLAGRVFWGILCTGLMIAVLAVFCVKCNEHP